ncbi:hypothetical protein C8Q76DRAFT_804543 [Earliella scabrosa]|nr:hypothetical protein C8Q76DRAFT_804543 [Earliella scabrosa]
MSSHRSCPHGRLSTPSSCSLPVTTSLLHAPLLTALSLLRDGFRVRLGHDDLETWWKIAPGHSLWYVRDGLKSTKVVLAEAAQVWWMRDIFLALSGRDAQSPARWLPDEVRMRRRQESVQGRSRIPSLVRAR